MKPIEKERKRKSRKKKELLLCFPGNVTSCPLALYFFVQLMLCPSGIMVLVLAPNGRQAFSLKTITISKQELVPQFQPFLL